jgi:hypothetical protein
MHPVLRHFSEGGESIEVVQAVGRRGLPVALRKRDGKERPLFCGILPDGSFDIAGPESGCWFSVGGSHVIPPVKMLVGSLTA